MKLSVDKCFSDIIRKEKRKKMFLSQAVVLDI